MFKKEKKRNEKKNNIYIELYIGLYEVLKKLTFPTDPPAVVWQTRQRGRKYEKYTIIKWNKTILRNNIIVANITYGHFLCLSWKFPGSTQYAIQLTAALRVPYYIELYSYTYSLMKYSNNTIHIIILLRVSLTISLFAHVENFQAVLNTPYTSSCINNSVFYI